MPPAVGAQQMRRLDNWAMTEFQLPLLVMMEHAGRALCELVLRRFHPGRTDPIVVLAGKGGNGGGALAAARHLLHRGYAVVAYPADGASKLRDETRKQLSFFRKEGGNAPAGQPEEVPWGDARLVVDGLLGYGLGEAPRGRARDLILRANESPAPKVALDLPSGLHPDTGAPYEPTVRAEATLTLALPKRGLLEPAARPFVGELYLGDIAFPRPLYAEFDTRPEDLFGDDILVRLPSPAARTTAPRTRPG